MQPATLKKFNDILYINTNGDYHAFTEDGKLKARMVSFDMSTFITATMDNVPGDLHLYTNSTMLNKYVSLFDSAFEVYTTEESILLTNEKMDVLIPAIEKEIAMRDDRPLKKEIVYDKTFELKLSASDIKKIFKSASIQDESLIKFEMAGHLVIEVGKVKHKMPDIKADPYTWYLKHDVVERVLSHVVDEATIIFPYDNRTPAKMDFTVSSISVTAYVMRMFP